jgi:hypothetical protein
MPEQAKTSKDAIWDGFSEQYQHQSIKKAP